LEKLAVHVPNFKSFFAEVEKKHVRRHAEFQQHRDENFHHFSSERQDAEGNSHHSEGNIKGTCTMVCLR